MSPQIFSREYVIRNKQGLHARPAALFVQAASAFQSKIQVYKKDGEPTDAKSLLGLLVLAVPFGSSIRISAEGADAQKAVETLGELIDRRFDEE